MSLIVDIEKKVGKFHLKTAFTMEQNGIFGLLGESGCGKSMTLRCIAGIQKPDKGKIILNDRILYDSEKRINLSPQKRKVGYLFQDYALFPNMTVEQNIAVVLNKKNNVEQYLEQFYLKGLEHHYPSMLSGGQKQRCAIARMMASKPELLLFDEPFSAVDRSLRWNLELQILDILKTIRKPVVFVSHDRDEIYHLCDSVGIMDWGQIKDIGTKQELFERPRTVAAARMIGCENIFPIRLERKLLGTDKYFNKNLNTEVSQKRSKRSYDRVTYIGIPAHAVKMTQEKEKSQVNGQIMKILLETQEKVMIVKIAEQNLYIRMGKDEGKTMKVGEKVGICIDSSKVWYLE